MSDQEDLGQFVRQNQALVKTLAAMGARLGASLRLLSAISSLSEVTVKDVTIQEAAQQILQTVVRDLEDVENCSLLIFDPAQDTLRLLAALGQADLLGEAQGPYNRDLAFRSGEGVAGRVFAANRPCFWHRKAPEVAWLKLDPSLSVPDSLACLPLSSQERPLGVFNLSFNQADPFDIPKQRDIILLGGVVGNILQTFLLRGELDEKAATLESKVQQCVLEIAERQHAEQALRESEEKYRTLVDNLSIGIFRAIPGERGRYLQANPAMAAILGFASLEELLASTPDHSFADPYQLRRFIRKVASQGLVREAELLLRRADGAPFWASITATAKRGRRGAVEWIDGVLEDISSRKATAEALRASEERFRSLSHYAPDIIYSLDTQGAFTYVNPAWQRILGHEPQEVVGRYFVSFVEPEEAQHYVRLFKQVRDGKESFSDVDGCLLAKDGSLRYFSLSAAPNLDSRGEVTGLVGLFIDITQRRLAEEALRQSQASLARAQSMARLGNWEMEIKSGQLSGSDEAYNIFGISRPQRPVTINDFLLQVHHSDRALVQESLRKALSRPGQISLEHRIVRPGGEIRIVHELAEVVQDEEGNPLKLMGAVQDITERRQSEEQMRLLARVFENTIEGILVTDLQGDIQMVNQAFTDITGYTSAEVKGHNPRLVASGRQGPAFYGRMWQELTGNGHWQGELWNRRQNGEIFPVWLTITAIKDSQGRTSHYVGVFHDITDLKRHQEQIKHQAYHDALTGLPNRLLFNDRLKVAIAHAHRLRQKLAVLFLDLDNFKNINDSLGHAVGDQLLQAVAKRLLRWVREEDTVARLGGDEFIILTQAAEGTELALHVAKRILDSLSAPFQVGSQELYINASMGITLYPEDGRDPESLVANADTAMYRAKESGRGSYKLFTPAMNARVVQRLALESSLRKALERQEFILHYQPKVNLLDGTMVGLEALVRWQRPEVGLVQPDDFIPVAEDTGLIIPLGQWVLRAACQRVKQWHREGFDDLHVAVNISPRQFQQKNLVSLVQDALESSGLPPQCLELEMTESVVMQSVEEAIVTLRELRELGVRLAMDDFGRGYSSLYYLKRFPMDALKIDRSFVSDIANADDASIVRTIISMSRSLGLKVVAEGVETAEQLDFLRTHSCDLVQGFLFSRPLPPEKIGQLLRGGKDYS